MKNYGTRLKEILTVKGIKQVELADAVGSNPKNINSYITGRAEPSLQMVSSIAKYLNVPLDYFLGEASLAEVLKDENASGWLLDRLENSLPQESYKIVELILLLQNKYIEELLDIVKELDTDSLREVLKQAEKEKYFREYKNVNLK